jgi:hypothetical protein
VEETGKEYETKGQKEIMIHKTTGKERRKMRD